VLIIFGGLGFFVWDDISGKKLRISKYHLHTKLMLSARWRCSSPTVLFLYTGKNASMQGMTAWERLLSAFFAAVTPERRGYNSVVLPEMSEGGTLLTTALMIIGAGPGSTGAARR
jgi:trk system potassium uptake protein TrkH